MSEIARITDFDAVVLPKAMYQYRDSTKLLAIVSAANKQADDIEAAAFEVRDLFWIDSAEGVQLDVIGAILVESRDGRSDAEYRDLLRAKGAQAYSATPEAIIGVLKALFGGTFAEYSPEWTHTPAQYRVRTDANITVDQLQAITGGGIQGVLAGFLQDANGNDIASGVGARINAVTATQN